MKLSTLSKSTQGVLVLTFGAILVAIVWIWRAPYAECFVNEGTCVYYVERNSNFFIADFLFAFLMFVLGAVVAVVYQRSWWQSGFVFQLALAIYSTVLSIGVALAGQFIRPLAMISELKADAGLELRTLGAIFVLPAIIQVVVTVSGLSHGQQQEHDESDH